MTTQRLNIAAVIAASAAFFAAVPAMAQEADATQTAVTVVAKSAMPAVSRVQIQAEAIEARRLGLTDGGEGPAAEATPAQRESIRLAGVRAAQALTAAATR